VCSDCAKDRVCPSCGKKVWEWIYPIFFVSIFMVIILSLILPVAVFDFQSYRQLVDMEVTSVEDVEVGEEVKIFGTINSTQKIVIDGYSEGSGDDEVWVWRVRSFYVEDETGSIWVNGGNLVGTEGFRSIHSGPHDDNQYWNGDKISIIGEVFNYSSTGKTVRPHYIGEDPKDFGPHFMNVILLAGPVIISGIIALITGSILYIRMNKHKRNFRDFFPIRYLQEQSETKQIIEKGKWVDQDSRRIARSSLVLWIILILSLIAIFAYMIMYNDYSFMDNFCFSYIIVTILIFFLITFLLFILSRNYVKVSSIILKGIRIKTNIQEIEQVLESVISTLNTPYTKSRREITKGTFNEVKFDLRDDGIEITGNLIKTGKSFKFNLVLRFKKEVSTSFEEKIKTKLENAIDQYLDMKKTAA
jgi:hypothetical protein